MTDHLSFGLPTSFESPFMNTSVDEWRRLTTECRAAALHLCIQFGKDLRSFTPSDHQEATGFS